MLQSIYDRFVNDEFTMGETNLSDIRAVVAKKGQFKWSWLATKMHFFAIFGVVDHVSLSLIQNFTKEAFKFTKANYDGLPRGLQSGYACLSALISANVDSDAAEWTHKTPEKHFASFEIPIIKDISNNELHYFRKKPIWGRLYFGPFEKFINHYYGLTTSLTL